MQHVSHPEIIKRLRRAEGHLRAVTAMIEDGNPCVDVAQQLAAVERAIVTAKNAFIRDHIDNCLEGAATSKHGRAVLSELKAITKFL